MKNIIGKVLTGIGALVVLLLVLGLTESLMNKPIDQESATLKSDTDFVQDYKTSYMENCNEDGLYYEYCKCTLDYLFDNYSTKKIVNMSLDLLEKEGTVDYKIPDEMVKAVNSCLYLYK